MIRESMWGQQILLCLFWIWKHETVYEVCLWKQDVPEEETSLLVRFPRKNKKQAKINNTLDCAAEKVLHFQL